MYCPLSQTVGPTVQNAGTIAPSATLVLYLVDTELLLLMLGVGG